MSETMDFSVWLADPTSPELALTLAQTLSRSSIIPDEFRHDTGSVLLALDYAQAHHMLPLEALARLDVIVAAARGATPAIEAPSERDTSDFDLSPAAPH